MHFIYSSSFYSHHTLNAKYQTLWKNTFQKYSFFPSLKGEGWCLSYQQKDQLLKEVKKCLLGMFDVLDFNEASPGLPVNEQPHWFDSLN